MRTIFSILTIVFCILKGFSQYEIIIEAKVLDRISNQPIPYVNIGFVDEAVGTVSDANGNFTLIYNEEEIDDNTLLRFSALGYKALEIKEEQLMDYFKRSNIVYLIPTPLQLDEITVSNEKRSAKTIGINTLDQGTVGYWKDKEALGGEIATLIKISQKDTKLLQLSFSVVENVSDSIKVRVNVYEFKKAYPGEKVLLQNVYKVIDEKEGVVNINLEPYNIHVNEDILISLELLEVHGEEIGFAISGNTDYGPSYIRYVSQDDWEKYRYQGINYALSVSYPVKEGKDQQIERKPPERVTVYWDVSAYKDNSETSKEIELLKDYLQALEAVKVEVVKFNNIIQDRKVFQITQGDANDLIQYIQSSDYEGFPNYSLLLQDNPFESQYILLFTDGKDPFFQLESNIYVPVFPVSSNRDADHLELQKVSRYTDGYYVNLSELKTKEALDFLLYEFEDTRDFSKTAKSSTVSGKVKMDTIPMQGVRVGVKETLREVTTDSEGYFQINANQGETLTFEALGTFSKEVVVQNNSSIDVQLESEGEILDQVTLEARKREEELNIGQGNRRGV
ncbi:MAG: carboxypeptidase-like regulatory domain-containing protein, partial [Flavobacteriaceae bacterium]|nr:carboxypeptidase-like regulatory domain-containing protein [Flavobacteriaceae bacterium]